MSSKTENVACRVSYCKVFSDIFWRVSFSTATGDFTHLGSPPEVDAACHKPQERHSGFGLWSACARQSTLLERLVSAGRGSRVSPLPGGDIFSLGREPEDGSLVCRPAVLGSTVNDISSADGDTSKGLLAVAARGKSIQNMSGLCPIGVLSQLIDNTVTVSELCAALCGRAVQISLLIEN